MAVILLWGSVIGLLLVLNARWPRRDPVLLIPSFFASWLTIELAPLWLVAHGAAVVALLAAGALEGLAGVAGLVVAVITAAGLVGLIAESRRTTLYLADRFGELVVGEGAPRFPRSHLFFPVLLTRRPGVRRVRNIVYRTVGRKALRLDVIAPKGPLPVGAPRPGILQVHGGAWVLGDKREQGLPLLHHLAANGWVGINANYRLSPRATFPDALEDLKAAIAWYRTHARDFGADPDFLCITGGSAGGHLAALVALTADDARYVPRPHRCVDGPPGCSKAGPGAVPQDGRGHQPGEGQVEGQVEGEDVDLQVRAAVPFYGVYDVTNRLGTQHDRFVRVLMERIVFKATVADQPELFRDGSPIDLVHRGAPPFFVIHGDRDSLVPVEDARAFVGALEAVSESPVLYAELAGAQHAFDVFPSFRSARVIEAVERFLHGIHTDYLTSQSPHHPQPPPTI